MHYIDMKISKQRLREIIKEEFQKEDFGHAIKQMQGYSSKEAKDIVDKGLRVWAKDLRKVEGRVIKDWMSKAKAGVLDFFDIEKGLTQGDARRAHPEETQFLHKILTKDKILNRFRSYFGGKKAMKNRTAKRGK